MKKKKIISERKQIAVKQKIDQIAEKLKQAFLYHQQGELLEAQVIYEGIIKEQPDNFNALHLLGLVFHQQKNYLQAIELMDKAIAVQKNHATVYSNRGIALKELKRFDEALNSYNQAITLKPDYAEAYSNRGNVFNELKQFEKAIFDFNTAISLDSNYAEAHFNRGLAYYELEKIEDAITDFHKAIALKPDYVDPYFNLGVHFQKIREFEKAIAYYDKVEGLTPYYTGVHVNCSVALNELEQYEEAIKSCNKAIEIKPDYAEAHFNRGNAFSGLRKFDEAIACYDMAITFKQDFSLAYANRSYVFLIIGRFVEGWRDYVYRESLQYEIDLLPCGSKIRRAEQFLPFTPQNTKVCLVKSQGLGDELFFLRFAAELKNRGANRVTYIADERIVAMVRRANIVDDVLENSETNDKLIDVEELFFSVGDLPLLLGMSNEGDIKPAIKLTVLPDKKAEILNRLAPYRSQTRPLIGITWRAGTEAQSKLLFKEISLTQLASSLKAVNATFVVVQRNPKANEIVELETVIGHAVIDCSDLNDDLEGMLALMELLDDYIGVSNTNMHLRASVGKTARVLVPKPEFRWLHEGSTSPWFPGFKVYRAVIHDWNNALNELKRDLLKNEKNELQLPLNLFVGFDQREAVAYHVFCQSVLEKSSVPVRFTPLALNTLQGYAETHTDGSNQFIYSRFLVPFLMNYQGWALFADGDMICQTDITDLFALTDDSKAVMVVKHDYLTKAQSKYLGNKNENYPRKNWSSIVLWNCGHLSNKCLSPDYVMSKPGSHLHRFAWLDDELIGELPASWNWLTTEYPDNKEANLLHYTLGTPCFKDYWNCDMADIWHDAYAKTTQGIGAE